MRVCVRACMRACMRACVCVEFTFVIKYVNDVNVCATCSCSVIFITGCAQHMNVQPQIGGVLGEEEKLHSISLFMKTNFI